MNDLLNRWNDDMARAVEQACQALVQIRNGRAGAGAGTIWHPDGLILTNAHVASRRGLQVTLPDGRTLPAPVVASFLRGECTAYRGRVRGQFDPEEIA